MGYREGTCRYGFHVNEYWVVTGPGTIVQGIIGNGSEIVFNPIFNGFQMVKTATILVRGYFNHTRAKTAHGLIRHGKKYKIVSVVDETLAGRDAGEVMGLGNMEIPIMGELDTNAEVLIIGVAPPGGKLPPAWREDIIEAIKSGMDIVSGLHEFISDDPELVALAQEYGVKVDDVRKPPNDLDITKHIKPTIPVVLVSGTDAACGKRTTAIELYNTALARGINAGFIATGQTGIMIGCDAGIAVDRLPADFVAGAVEKMVQDVIEQGKELIFVEGQGSILHYAYSSSTIGILHGAWPKHIILAHPALRTHRSSNKSIPLPEPKDEITALELLAPEAKVIGLALNCKGREDHQELCREYEERTGLPTVDVIADKAGAGKLLDTILEAKDE